jgi:hypothetical protein
MKNIPIIPKGCFSMNKRPQKDQNTQVTPPDEVASLLAPLKSLWLGTCARYTVLCLILLVTSAIASDSLTVTYVDMVRFFLLLPFGLCLTLAAWVRRSDKLSAGAKVGLHALSVLGGFYLFCYLPYQLRTKPSGMQIFVILLLVVILYAITMAIVAAVTAKTRQKKLDEVPYESQYRKE